GVDAVDGTDDAGVEAEAGQLGGVGDGLLEGALAADAVVAVGAAAVKADLNISEVGWAHPPGLADRRLPPGGGGDDVFVAELVGELDDAEVIGVQGGLATQNGDLRAAHQPPGV